MSTISPVQFATPSSSIVPPWPSHAAQTPPNDADSPVERATRPPAIAPPWSSQATAMPPTDPAYLGTTARSTAVQPGAAPRVATDPRQLTSYGQDVISASNALVQQLGIEQLDGKRGSRVDPAVQIVGGGAAIVGDGALAAAGAGASLPVGALGLGLLTVGARAVKAGEGLPNAVDLARAVPELAEGVGNGRPAFSIRC